MRYLRKWQLAFVCLLALALLPFAPAPRGTAQAPGYTVTDLGTLGGDASRAYGLDECGRVVGESQAAAGETAHFRPFLWNAGTMTDVGTLGGPSGAANSINQSGTVVGSALTASGLQHPFVRYEGSAKFDLGTLPGGFTAEAYDVNASGQVVGVSEEGSNLQDRAFIWIDANNNQANDSGEQQALSATWGTPIRALAINDAGQVAGNANVTGLVETHAFVTIGGVAVDLGTLGGAVSFGYDVNNSGEVVGRSYIPIPPGTISNSFHAFRWTDANGNGQSDAGEMQDLGTLGGRHSYAYSNNDTGQVVGASEFQANNNSTHAFIWSSATGTMQDLNAVVTGTGWTFEEARAINDRGQIVGFGRNPQNQLRAFLLTPTNVGPAPCDPTPTPTPSAGTLQFSAAAYAVGEDGGSVVISVTRAGGDDGAVAVGYATSNGTATAGSDYTAAGGTLNFADGEVSKTFSVDINDDALDEPGETVNLTLSSPGGGAALGAPSAAVLTITDNDSAPALSVGDASVTEGNAGAVNTTFAVTLSAASGQTVTVNYATADNSATQPGDYNPKAGTLTFLPGDTEETFTVEVVGDTLNEGNETFNVNLSSPANATVLDSQGVGTINDDDGPPALSVGDVTVTEGNSGTTATFTVSLLPASGQAVSVNYATANGTATAGGDYTAINSTPLNFAAGETSKTITVNVAGDTTPEPHETFFVNLSGAASATIEDGQGQGTINNDDASLSVSDVTANEGQSGSAPFTFTVSIPHPSVNAVSFNYATAAGGTATAGGDYTAVSSTLLSIPAGGTSATFAVQVIGDTTFEGDETLNVALSGATNASVNDGAGVGTITNDDTAPAFSVGDVAVTEGDAGADVTATFTVTLSAASGLASSVNYATANGTAVAPGDYAALNSTPLNFAAGETSKSVAVTVKGDTLFEGTETFNVNLSGASGASIADGQGQGTITDNDTQPTLQFSAATYTVGEGGGTATVTVSRTGGSNGGVTVGYATSNGSATAGAGGDYTAASGTLTFAEGDNSETFTVAVANDALDETDESVNLTLSGPGGGAALGEPSAATLTITDDDGAPSLSINDVSVPELDVGNPVATFTVTLSAPSGRTVTVNYATANGTASGTDYTPTSGTLTFNPGDTSENIFVQVTGDNFDEEDEETFFVNLSGATNATIADAQGVGKIGDNDETPKLSVGDITITEGDSGTTNATFTVSLGPATARTVTVNYATANNTAAAGSDYAATSGTLTFEGESSKTVTVQVSGDTVNEANESFYVVLSNPTNASILDTHGECFITDDDATRLAFSQAAYNVGESAHFVTVTVTRAGDTTQAVGVDFATSDGTATERRDYTAVSGRLLFAAGETSKTFDVLLTEDSYQEAEETINLTLSNPTGGAGLGTQAAATVQIAADDANQPQPNPIDDTTNFVRQHYHDFLNREPDAPGLAFWVGDIEQCGANAACREVKRINVSAAFFLSIEFQQTGYLVYRTYKAAYGDATSPNVAGTVPVVRLQEFLPDTRRIGQGVVVGEPDWELKLDANKNAYMAEFVARQRFLTAYPLTLTAAEFVDKLNQNAGVVLTQAERDALVSELSNGAKTRAQVLRALAENTALQQNEFRRAFVLMQFYGYLRRNPDDPQDVDFRGWKFWLDKLNQFNGNFVQAEMVKAFLDSTEYRQRFAP